MTQHQELTVCTGTKKAKKGSFLCFQKQWSHCKQQSFTTCVTIIFGICALSLFYTVFQVHIAFFMRSLLCCICASASDKDTTKVLIWQNSPYPHFVSIFGFVLSAADKIDSIKKETQATWSTQEGVRPFTEFVYQLSTQVKQRIPLPATTSACSVWTSLTGQAEHRKSGSYAPLDLCTVLVIVK